MNHADLPASYIKKCKEFFGEVAQKVTSGKPQAVKQQAASSDKQQRSDKP
jgi:type IV secretory pathway TrbL component